MIKTENSFREATWVIKIIFLIILLFVLFAVFIGGTYSVQGDQMNDVLHKGDRIFASKIAYGPRLWIPFIGNPSKSIRPYGGSPQKNDIVLYNPPAISLYNNEYESDGEYFRSIFASRVVALPSDTINFEDGKFFINNEAYVPANQPKQIITIPINVFSIFMDEANDRNINFDFLESSLDSTTLVLTKHDLDSILQHKELKFLKPNNNEVNEIVKLELIVPAKGMKIEATPMELAVYKNAIEDENPYSAYITNNILWIDGKVAKSYTFKKDYYWLMNDNDSIGKTDSRSFGFVPFNNIQSKAKTIIYSKHNGLFKSIKNK